ncbi:MAG TPA: tol-pal system protein YbgF, partial [Steroidobacteraceae bacterium]
MLTMRWLSLAALLALAGCASEAAEPDPTLVRLNDLDTRLGRIERVLGNDTLAGMARRIDALESQLRDLRGSAEEQQHSGDALRKQQRDLYADLDKRISALEGQLHAAQSGAAVGGSGAAAGDTDPQAAYNRAFEQLKSGNFDAAIKQFQDFMDTYPKSSLQDNAQYWIGEAHYVARQYDEAAEAFRAVGEHYPNSRKAPDALLKLGFTLAEQK